jgi:hypothetical protein
MCAGKIGVFIGIQPPGLPHKIFSAPRSGAGVALEGRGLTDTAEVAGLLWLGVARQKQDHIHRCIGDKATGEILLMPINYPDFRYWKGNGKY